LEVTMLDLKLITFFSFPASEPALFTLNELAIELIQNTFQRTGI